MGKHLSKLTEAQKVDVVLRLAGYDSPPAIARSLKEEFDITIAVSSIAFYDPTSSHGGRCPERWATLFHETRAKILAGLSDVGATNKMVRVRWLDQMARREMAEDNSAEARALLKQVAEEMSEGPRNLHDHHGVSVHDLNDAELDARLTAASDRLAAAMAARGLGPGSAERGSGGGVLAGPDGEGGGAQSAGEPVSG
jgi:hypothetical protein